MVYIFINHNNQEIINSKITNIIKIIFVIFSCFKSFFKVLLFSFNFIALLFICHFDSSNKNCDFLKSINETEFLAISSLLHTFIANSLIISSFLAISCLKSLYISVNHIFWLVFSVILSLLCSFVGFQEFLFGIITSQFLFPPPFILSTSLSFI